MDDVRTCPRCGHGHAPGPSCPRCGVIFAKLRERPRSPDRAAPHTAASRGRPLGPLLGVAAILVAGFFGLRALRPKPAAPSAPVEAVPVAATADVPPPVVAPGPPLLPPLAEEIAAPSGLSQQDRAKAEELRNRLDSRRGLGWADVQAAEALVSAHPEEPALRQLLGAVLSAAAWRERDHRRHREAAEMLQRATALLPQAVPPWLALLQVQLEAGDWAGAEAAARGALSIQPRNVDALRGLGYALVRQDRNREATEALSAALAVQADTNTQALLDRLRKGIADESGMTEQQLSHFHVRYDGEEHEDVGREILRALERHYTTLTSALDHQPAAAIPVILFARQGYYDASGAPAWAGGNYDSLDGRIRIPIGGLTASLTSDLDGTLIHELTHAFVADRTRGTAPREIHEGLAQYMEGKRVASELTAEQLTALADGRLRGVGGYYLGALSFVEYLIANRGLGGMNETLKAMGETGNVDEAFRRVHGQTYGAAVHGWRARLAQQHGS